MKATAVPRVSVVQVLAAAPRPSRPEWMPETLPADQDPLRPPSRDLASSARPGLELRQLAFWQLRRARFFRRRQLPKRFYGETTARAWRCVRRASIFPDGSRRERWRRAAQR